MTYIYYFLGIFFVLHEFVWMCKTKDRLNASKRFIELHKVEKDIPWNKNSEEYKEILISKIFSMLFMLWLFLGLFTFQWPVFAFIILFNLIIIMPVSKLLAYSKADVALHWLNSLLGFAFGLFVIINGVHLKLDTWAMVKHII